MPSPFPCSPVIREWSWKKTQIEKKIHLVWYLHLPRMHFCKFRMNPKCCKRKIIVSLDIRTLHKKWSFSLRILSVNMTKSADSCGFGHIYWKYPSRKTSFFMEQNFLHSCSHQNHIVEVNYYFNIYFSQCWCWNFQKLDKNYRGWGIRP